jgi:hypothetical protein
MSSPSEGAEPAPASSADSIPSSQQHSDSGASGEGPRKASAIRIGSQRYGVRPPPAVAKPILASPVRPQPLATAPAKPAEAPADVVASVPTVEPDAAVVGVAAPEVPAEAPLAAETAPSADEAAPSAAPTLAPRGPRPDRPRGVKHIPAPPPVTAKVELPNIRAGLSPELEMEYLEALGG